MTREKAREFLINISYKLGDMSVEYLSDKDGEKMREAIKALEHEPCSDAISREAALEAILTRVPDWCGGDKGGNLVGRNETASYIRNLPSVTPKQKTWEWIKLKDQKPEELEDVLVRDSDGDVTCAYLCDDTDFLERFSGEIIDDVVEWMEISI